MILISHQTVISLCFVSIFLTSSWPQFSQIANAQNAPTQNTSGKAARGSVFVCEDDSGKTYYCSDPAKYKKSTEAKLPLIIREDIDSRITELRAAALETCTKHGGERCELGADQDGSVICADGYRDASLPFETICNFARLQMLSFAIADKTNGEISLSELRQVVNDNLPLYSIQLSVRNTSPSRAKNVTVSFDTRRSRSILADGPNFIEPYGSADFSLVAAKLTGAIPIWNEIRYKLTCSNCADLSGNLHLR